MRSTQTREIESDRRGNTTTSRRSPLRPLLLSIVLVALGFTVAVVLPAAWVFFNGREGIYEDPARVPPQPVAVVFGAGLMPDGSPSPMLADRVDAAVELYRAGKVQRILMTGDNSSVGYNEVAAMKQRAVSQGVPAGKVNLDYAGFRTYDSCYRARAIFGIDRAVLVTQRYHLPRAIYLARSFGIEAVGLAAGLEHYPGQEYYVLREFAAMVVSWYEANVVRPEPRYLGDPVDLEQQNSP